MGAFALGVYENTHALDESVHEVALNDPAALPSVHDTVPVGVVLELDVSLTLTTKIEPPLDTVDGFWIMDVVVLCNTFTVKAEMPALPE